MFDVNSSLLWATRAEAAGDAHGAVMLARFFMHGFYVVEPDCVRAVELLGNAMKLVRVA